MRLTFLSETAVARASTIEGAAGATLLCSIPTIREKGRIFLGWRGQTSPVSEAQQLVESWVFYIKLQYRGARVRAFQVP